jgi:hypothetical protein
MDLRDRVSCWIATANKDAIFAIFSATFVWISSFTRAFLFCRINPLEATPRARGIRGPLRGGEKYSMEELCQPVGNAKICGELDWDAATALVLARRYKILGRIDADSFKAHDLALDQTVKVRQAMLTGRRDGDIWRQKVQQLASVRDPNFLNVLDLISDKSGEFIITERPRGQSIAEVFRVRSRFDLEDLLRLMIPLASALDFAAAFACCANPISASWLFTETRRSCAVDSEPPFIIKLDIWELVSSQVNKNGKTLKDEKDRYLCIFPWKRSGDLGQRIRLLIERGRYQLGPKEVRTAKATSVYAE